MNRRKISYSLSVEETLVAVYSETRLKGQIGVIFWNWGLLWSLL